MAIITEQILNKAVLAHREGSLEDAERLYRSILQSDPQHPDANHNLGLILQSAEAFDSALLHFKSAVEVKPEMDQFWLSYIDALINGNQIGLARDMIEQAGRRGFISEKLDKLADQLDSEGVNSNANSYSSTPPKEQLMELAEAYKNGRHDAAEELALSLSNQYPDHNFSWKILGVVLKLTGRASGAVSAGEKSVEITPSDAEAHFNLGNTFKDLGRLEEAEACYREAIKWNPRLAQAHNNMGIVLKSMDKLGEAEESCRRAIDINSNFTEAYNNLGTIYQDLGKLDEAQSSYEMAIVLMPNFAAAYCNLGNTLKELQRWDKAEENYKQAIALAPESPLAYHHLGVTLELLGRLAEAETNFTRAILCKPDYSQAHYNLGRVYGKQGRAEEAEKSYRQAIVFDSRFADAHNNLGVILKKMDRLDEAEVCFKQVVGLRPDFAEGYVNLGSIQQGLGKLHDARKSYISAIDLQPQLVEAHNNLGVTLKELGRLGEAESSYLRALKFEPSYAVAYSNLGLLQYLIGDIEASLAYLRKADKLDPTLHSNKVIMTILQSRKAAGRVHSDISGSNASFSVLKSHQYPLILNRGVESDLIHSLYELDSVELDKFDNSRGFDPRFGNGECSEDFDLFKSENPVIQFAGQDLVSIVKGIFKTDILVSESFFNILGAGGGTIPHTHLGELDRDKDLSFGDQKYSLVYYLSVGDQSSSDPGILELYNPRHDVLPENGMIIIFPAGREHSSKYGGDKDRIMIGINFYCL